MAVKNGIEAGHWCLMPSCLRGKAQEDPGSNPAWANTLKNPISKILYTKKGWQSGSNGRVPG
jgi:hypothetical protein